MSSGTSGAPAPSPAPAPTPGPAPAPAPAPGPAPTAAPASFKPPKPIHGGVVQTSSDTIVPYTGGKPKVGFGDIDAAVKRTQTVLPTMQRPLGSSSSIKGQYYRITCTLEEKFQRNGNRIRYERMIMKHFERYGLDTITYLKGPDGDMLSIITDHAKFTLEAAEKAEKDQMEFEYDSYDKANVLDAIEYVISSLDDHLEEQIHQVSTPEDGFITFWMKLMSIIKSTSIDYYESIKSKIRNLRISDEPGQDVTLLCTKYYQFWKLLDQGGAYDNNLTVHMLKELLRTGTESYRFELIAIKKKLDEMLRKLNNLSYSDIKRELAKAKLDVLSILEQVKQEYRRLYDDGEWPAASTKRDKNGLSSTYGQVNAAFGSDIESTLKRMEANVLQRVQQGIKQTDSSTKKKGTCFKCGSPDHWADKCPERQKTRSPSKQQDKNKSSKRRGPRSGKFPPPKDGESEIRTDDKGVKHFWCAKCRSWRTTHSTATHKKKSELPAQAQAHAGLAQAEEANVLEMASTPYAFALIRQEPMNTTTRIPCTISTAKDAILAFTILTCALGLHSYVPILLITTLLIMNKNHGTLQHWFQIPPWCNKINPTPVKPPPQEPPSAKRWAPLKSYKPKSKNHKNKFDRQFRRRKFTSPHWFTPNNQDQSYCFEIAINQAQPSSAHSKILIDSGANVCVTNDLSHFIAPPEPPSSVKTLVGMGKALGIEAYGKVRWTFTSSTDQPITLVLPCCYIPTSNFCILSTSILVKSYPDSTVNINSKGLQLNIKEDDTAEISIDIDPTSQLPFATLTAPHSAQVNASTASSRPPNASLMEANNYNLTPLQKTLLKWHYRLGHKNFRTIQWMFRHMYLAFTTKDRHTHHQASKITDLPICTACQYAKQRRKTTPGTKKVPIPQQVAMTRQDILFPGQRVAVDHLKSSLGGRLPHTYGKESEDDRYSGSCVFVDYATNFKYIHHQVPLNSDETLAGKKIFESLLARHGVIVQSYISDNGTAFRNADYTAHLEQFHQHIAYSAVGAHHSNGTAERAIGTISSITRALLHHQALHWPEVADPALWPFAADHATRLSNCIPDIDSGLQPVSALTKTTFPRHHYSHFHVWGCPAYVLDGKLADGKKLPKWSPRSERYMYLGISPNHSGAVPLLLNLSTGKVVTNYHVVCDNYFTTVSSSSSNPINFDHDHWYRTFGLTPLQYVQPDSTSTSPSSSVPENTTPQERIIHHDISSKASHQSPFAPPPVSPHETADVPSPPINASSPDRELLRERESLPERNPPPIPSQREYSSVPAPTSIEAPPASLPSPQPPLQREKSSPAAPQKSPQLESPKLPSPKKVQPQTPVSSSPPPLRRSKRENRRPPARFLPSAYALAAMKDDPNLMQRTSGLKWNGPSSKSALDKDIQDPLINFWTRMMDGFSPNMSDDTHKYSLASMLDEVYSLKPISPYMRIVSDHDQSLSNALVAAAAQSKSSNQKTKKKTKKSKSDPLTFSLHEAMRSPHWPDLRAAFDIEIKALEAHGTWEEVPMSEAEKGGHKIIPSTLVGRIKVNPLGEYIKSKGRCCLRGDLQDPTEDNYSPVASWSSIRTILFLSQLYNRVTCTIDFSNAFVQATLPEGKVIYMGIPPGYASSLGPRTCLKLKKSIYGDRLAPRTWLHFIQEKLKLLGMSQSKNDPCVWFGNGLILAQYVDDFGISAESSEDIDRFVTSLQELGLELTRESSFSEFLGIKFTTHKDGSIEMTQPGLIKKILEATDMTEAKANRLPYPPTLLSKDKKGEPYTEKWNYLSILGMCLYLSTNSRPDLIFAVSQLARFSANPKQSHARAMKHMLRYLNGTMDKGTLIAPGRPQVEMYVDADYAGLFGIEDPEDKDSARSRMGYVVRLGNFPIVAKSMLHTSVVQSTAESEYTALAYALKVLIPLQHLIRELLSIIGKDELTKKDIKMKAKVFEDNQAAFHLATNQRITSRSRYFHTKLHWFFHELNKEDSVFTIEYCPTDNMLADWYTKPAKPEGFEKTRLKLIGW